MFKILDFTKGEVVAIEINGQLQREDYDIFIGLLEKAKSKHNHAKLFIHVNEIGGIELQDFTQYLKDYFEKAHHIDKLAVVGNNPVDKIVAKVADPYVEDDDKGKVKYFKSGEIDAAKQWILK